MVTALVSNSAHASVDWFGKGTCVLMQPNMLASANRHVAFWLMYASQSRSAPTDARNRSPSGGGVERVAVPRWARAAPRGAWCFDTGDRVERELGTLMGATTGESKVWNRTWTALPFLW